MIYKNVMHLRNYISEIKSVVQKLKNGKSAGSDNILNEYIKYTLDDMLAHKL